MDDQAQALADRHPGRCGTVRSREAGSGVRIPPRQIAETTNEIASIRIAIGAVRIWTSRPRSRTPQPRRPSCSPGACCSPRPAPRARSPSAGTTARRSRRGRSGGRPRTRRPGAAQPSRPMTAASGIETSSTARPTSVQIISGRRRRRSTQTPATRPMTSPAKDRPSGGGRPGPARRPGSGSRSAAARSDRPGSGIETVWPAQSFRKSGWRQRPSK